MPDRRPNFDDAQPLNLELQPHIPAAVDRERAETLASIREGLADIEAGRTYPVEDVIRELRAAAALRTSRGLKSC